MTNNGRSIPDIFSDLIVQLTALVRKEGQLARAEISENISKAALALAFIVGGAVLLIPALVILLDAAVAGIEAAGLALYWSALIVGGVVLILGAALMWIGKNRLDPKAIVPARTVHQLERDATVAKEHLGDTQYGNTGVAAERAADAAADHVGATVGSEQVRESHEHHRAA